MGFRGSPIRDHWPRRAHQTWPCGAQVCGAQAPPEDPVGGFGPSKAKPRLELARDVYSTLDLFDNYVHLRSLYRWGASPPTFVL